MQELDSSFDSLKIVVKGTAYLTEPHRYFYQYQNSSNSTSFVVAIQTFDIDFLILGMLWMQGKKITFNIEKQTVSVYHNYNCTFTPLSDD